MVDPIPGEWRGRELGVVGWGELYSKGKGGWGGLYSMWVDRIPGWLVGVSLFPAILEVASS